MKPLRHLPSEVPASVINNSSTSINFYHRQVFYLLDLEMMIVLLFTSKRNLPII